MTFGAGAAFLLAFLAAPQSSSTDAPAPASPPTPPPRPTRTERLARQKQELLAELAKVDAFGHEEEFRAALQRLHDGADASQLPKDCWVQVQKGWLPLMAVDHWLQWNKVGQGRPAPLALDFDVPNHPFSTIVDLSDQLHAHDVEFLMVLFPSRLQLYPELVLTDLGDVAPERFRGMVGATTRFLLALNEKGVETVNLAPVFADARHVPTPEGVRDDLYLYRNKHWTPRAAELAASVLANRLREMPWFEAGPLKEGVDFEIKTVREDFSSDFGGQAPDRTPEPIEMHQVRPRGKPLSPYDARRSPITLLSDSFAKFYAEHTASFPDQLRRFTGWHIDLIASMGGGELQCREVMARRRDQCRGKKVVIWMLQENNLRPKPDFRPVDLFAE
jgi:hypothetical protein